MPRFATPFFEGLRRLSRLLAIVAMVAGIVLFLNFGGIPAWLAPYTLPLLLGAVGAASLLRAWRRGLRREVSRGAGEKIAEFGGGMYGSVALVTWVYLEATDLFADFVEAGGILPFLENVRLVNLVVEAVEFAISAALWPFYWFGDLGFAAVAGVFIAVGIADSALHLVRRRQRARVAVDGFGEGAASLAGSGAGAAVPLASSEEKP